MVFRQRRQAHQGHGVHLGAMSTKTGKRCQFEIANDLQKPNTEAFYYFNSGINTLGKENKIYYHVLLI